MNRRGFLKGLIAAPVAALTVLKLAAKRVAPWTNHEYTITFPDGSRWGFSGYVVSKRHDELTILPTGPMTVTQSVVEPSWSTDTHLSHRGHTLGRVMDITPPKLERMDMDHEGSWVPPGLQRRGEITFHLNP